MVDIRRNKYKINIVVDSDEILCLNKKHVEKGLNRKNLSVNTVKFSSGYRKNRYQLLDKPKNNPS